ncbi:MAG: hypothetical protein GEU90_02270 [Gemmatimonas sp.]|nr:hypothetical protein [Gemmatimonas sp.]
MAILSFAVVLLLLAVTEVAGQQEGGGSTYVHAAEAPLIRAHPITTPIEVDGELGEDVWAEAVPATGFTQREPVEGAPVSEPTEVRILYDEEALYIGALLRDSALPSTRLGRRDADFDDSDLFVVELDSYHDHRTGFGFSVNPSGVRGDRVLSGGGGGFGDDQDESWDPVWTVETTVDEDGWVAEMRIPFSQLRFGSAEVQTWGIQLERVIARTQEEAQFAFTPLLERGGVHRFGHLDGLQQIGERDPLEILPYASLRADYRFVPRDPDVDFTNPYRSGSDFTPGLGADIKYRVTSNFTVDATLNPDFGQVEVDPAVVNLSAFETRFDERRPFFVEGAEILRFGGPGGDLLYSRRIGDAPGLDAPDNAVYADVPDQTTIVGAGKVTGRTSSGWSIGVMEAVTAREHADFVMADEATGDAVVEPLANYMAARVRRDLRQGASHFGAIATAVNRSLGSTRLRERYRGAAYTGGVDFAHDWADRTWSIDGGFTASHIQGGPEVITAAQRSSARYYHRPDADYLELDPDATSLSGYTASLSLDKRAGAVTGGIGFDAVSAGYEINDLGFQTDADRISLSTDLGYEQTVPGSVFQSWEINSGPDLTFNFGGDLIEADIGIFARGEFVNFWEAELRFSRFGGTLNDRLTRGGPLSREPVGYSFGFGVETDPRRSYSLSPEIDVDWSPAAGWSTSFETEVEWRPLENLNIEVQPEVSFGRSEAQYVASFDDPFAEETFGRRYFFAALEQTEIALSTRVDVTFTPGLTLELYAQPLLASGEYATPKQLRAPRTFDFLEFGHDLGSFALVDGRYSIDPDGAGPAPAFDLPDRDFNLRSLRGNAVLRWEYRPGSTLFLVWQQSRSDELDVFSPGLGADDIGRFDFGRDARDLLSLRPDNIFMIKATYWLNP